MIMITKITIFRTTGINTYFTTTTTCNHTCWQAILYFIMHHCNLFELEINRWLYLTQEFHAKYKWHITI